MPKTASKKNPTPSAEVVKALDRLTRKLSRKKKVVKKKPLSDAAMKRLMQKTYIDNVFAWMRKNPGVPVPLRKLAQTRQMKPWLPENFPEQVAETWKLVAGGLADLS